jgi:hypothetical protein
MSYEPPMRLSQDDLDAEVGMALPAKEVISLLDLRIDIDVALDLAAPIDLAIAANANIAAPIDAAVTANVLSFDSDAHAMADQGVMLDQYISGAAIAHAPQDAAIDQSNDVIDDGTHTALDGADLGDATDLDGTDALHDTLDGTNSVQDTATSVTQGSLDGDLLNVDVKVDLDADLVAPVAGAVAANANVAAPIDAAAGANVGSFGSEAIAVAEQDAIIHQTLDNVTAEAIADQDADVTQ